MVKTYQKTFPPWKDLILVAIGSIPAALLRWQLHNDFLLNILGSIIIGFLFGCQARFRLKLIIGIGFCGSLTTYSGWMNDIFGFVVAGNLFQALALLLSTLLIGLIGVGIGLWAGTKIKGSILH